MFMSAAQHSGFVMFFAQTPLLALRVREIHRLINCEFRASSLTPKDTRLQLWCSDCLRLPTYGVPRGKQHCATLRPALAGPIGHHLRAACAYGRHYLQEVDL